MFRRTAVIAVTLVLLVAACGGERQGANEPADRGQREPLPLEEQLLDVGVGPDRHVLGPDQRPDLGKFRLYTRVFDNLVRYASDREVEPMLAERWDYSENENTYTFYLRRGVKFHDGVEFTASDVAYTFGLVAAASPGNAQGIATDSVKIVDSHTVAITPITENKRLIEQLVHPQWGVNRNESDPMQPIGTGPFRFVEYRRDNRLVVERFDDYWDPSGAARAKGITFHFIADEQARVLALRSGELDIIEEVPLTMASDLEIVPGIEVVTAGVGSRDRLIFNIKGSPPYDLGRDPVIREAVALAIDRPTIAEQVYGPYGERAVSPFPQEFGSHGDVIEGVPHDPERAGQLLDEAGWLSGPDGIRVRDGRRLSLVYTVFFPSSRHGAAPELVQDQLKRVGIEVKIELPADLGVTQARNSSGQYDLLEELGSATDLNPCAGLQFFHYSKSANASIQFRSPGGETDVGIEACSEAVDLDDAQMHAAEATHELVDVEHAAMALAGVRTIWAKSDRVAGFDPHPIGTFHTDWAGAHLVR